MAESKPMSKPMLHSLAPGECYEVPIDIHAPSILQFSFSSLEGGTVEFSVVHKTGGKKQKETQLLPASTYTENIGEVLLPGQGVCIVRFYNPTGWFYSSPVKVRFSLAAIPTHQPAPEKAAPAKSKKSAATAKEAAPAAAPAVAEAPAAEEDAAAPASAAAAKEAVETSPLPPEMGEALSKQLARRPTVEEVTSQGIFRTPEDGAMAEQEQELLRAALQRQLEQRRPSEELREQGILQEEGVPAALQAERRKKRDSLEAPRRPEQHDRTIAEDLSQCRRNGDQDEVRICPHGEDRVVHL